MKQVNRVFLILVLVGVLNACGSAPPAAVETTPPAIIDLQVTPAVEHWLPVVATCAEGISSFGIYTQILPRSELSLDKSDLILRLGERLEDDPFVAVMGIEEIVVVVGEDVPVAALSLDSLQAVYNGEITRWGDVPEAENSQAEGAPIVLMAYPAGHEIEILFNRAFLDGALIQTAPQAYSTVEFLEELLDLYPTGIGYLLESQVPEGMRKLPITAEQPIFSGQYVLAIMPEEPQGALKALLACLQSGQ